MASSSLGRQAEPGDFSAFAARKKPGMALDYVAATPRLARVTPASQLENGSAPEMAASGIAEIDALTGGLPRGCVSEVCGYASSGRTSLLLAALASATQRQEVCALVDATDAFDPLSAAAAGVDFPRLLWVRCGTQKKNPAPGHRLSQKNPELHALEQALRVTDLLLQSGGFGLVMMDLCDIPFAAARRIPLATWFRFQRVIERTPTVLLLLTETPIAATCASFLLRLRGGKLLPVSPSLSEPAHAQLLEELPMEAELMRARMERKPVRSVGTVFSTKAVRIS